MKKEKSEIQYCNIAKKVLLTKWEEYIHTLQSNVDLLRSLNPDSIHDVRVTSRRIRALFTELKPFYQFSEELVNISKTITQLLGKRRELDVIKELLPNILPHNSPLITHFGNYIDSKREQESIHCLRAVELVTTLIEYHQSILDLPQVGVECYVKVLEKRLPKLQGKLIKIRKKIKKTSEEEKLNGDEIHQIRIRLKKIRYSLEISGILLDEVKEFLPYLKEVQEILGEWNDKRVFLSYLEEFKTCSSRGLSTEITSGLDDIRYNLQNLIEQKIPEIRSIILKNFNKQHLEYLNKGLKKLNKINCCK